MTNEEKFNLITRNLEEVLTPNDLKDLINSGIHLRHYIGFEISGKPHLGAIALMQKIKDFIEVGVECTIFIADWHTWLNRKLDGQFETIHRLGRDYWKQAMIAAYLCVDGDPKNLNFIQGTELYRDKPDFWATMVEVSQHTTLSRIKRSITIAGRQEGESIDFAILLYPAMQAADIFTMQINLAHAGMDQRKAHVIAKDVAMQIKTNPLRNKNGKQIKPVALHNHLILGLKKPPVWPIPKENWLEMKSALKMSKSDPASAVYIFDSPDDIRRKVNNAFCPENEVEFNPILDWVKHIIFHLSDTKFSVKRKIEFGGDIEYASYEEIEKDYVIKTLHPMDLKTAVAEWLIVKLEPARKHFEDPERNALLEEIEKLTAQNKNS